MPIHVERLFLIFTAFACNGSVANIVTVEAAVPLDGLGQLVSLVLRCLNGVAHGGCAQHATPRGHHLTGLIECSAGMEHFAFQLGGCVQTLDDSTFGVIARVAAGGKHDTRLGRGSHCASTLSSA